MAASANTLPSHLEIGKVSVLEDNALLIEHTFSVFIAQGALLTIGSLFSIESNAFKILLKSLFL